MLKKVTLLPFDETRTESFQTNTDEHSEEEPSGTLRSLGSKLRESIRRKSTRSYKVAKYKFLNKSDLEEIEAHVDENRSVDHSKERHLLQRAVGAVQARFRRAFSSETYNIEQFNKAVLDRRNRKVSGLYSAFDSESLNESAIDCTGLVLDSKEEAVSIKASVHPTSSKTIAMAESSHDIKKRPTQEIAHEKTVDESYIEECLMHFKKRICELFDDLKIMIADNLFDLLLEVESSGFKFGNLFVECGGMNVIASTDLKCSPGSNYIKLLLAVIRDESVSRAVWKDHGFSWAHLLSSVLKHQSGSVTLMNWEKDHPTPLALVELAGIIPEIGKLALIRDIVRAVLESGLYDSNASTLRQLFETFSDSIIHSSGIPTPLSILPENMALEKPINEDVFVPTDLSIGVLNDQEIPCRFEQEIVEEESTSTPLSPEKVQYQFSEFIVDERDLESPVKSASCHAESFPLYFRERIIASFASLQKMEADDLYEVVLEMESCGLEFGVLFVECGGMNAIASTDLKLSPGSNYIKLLLALVRDNSVPRTVWENHGYFWAQLLSSILQDQTGRVTLSTWEEIHPTPIALVELARLLPDIRTLHYIQEIVRKILKCGAHDPQAPILVLLAEAFCVSKEIL